MSQALALLGGRPVRRRSFTSWPLFGKKEETRLNYGGVSCPNSDLICREQGLWLEQSLLLGPRADMDDIVRAFEKIHEQRDVLTDWSRRAAARAEGAGR